MTLNDDSWKENGIQVVTLHIYIKVKTGQEAEFEELYRKKYVPTIREQSGFRRAQLLRPYDSDGDYEIDIYFETEELRERWASSPEHEEVWSQVEAVYTEATPRGFKILSED